MMLLPVKCVLVIGHGGCRMDFVAGWLGKLDGFIDVGWHINPVTGESYGERTTKMIDKTDITIVEQLLTYDYILTDNASLTVASGCHGYKLNNKLAGCNTNNLSIIRIIATNEYINQICWDFIVKTFLESPQTHNAVRRRIQQLSSAMSLMPMSCCVDYPTIDISYEQLLSVDGAQFIADNLGLNPTAEQYQIWQDALLLASSPEEIELHGHLWRKQDFF